MTDRRRDLDKIISRFSNILIQANFFTEIEIVIDRILKGRLDTPSQPYVVINFHIRRSFHDILGKQIV